MDSFSWHLRATRDIKKDEEITTGYIGDEESPAALRQKMLAPRGFKCTCESCQDAQLHDPHRLRCAAVYKRFHMNGGWQNFKNLDLPSSGDVKSLIADLLAYLQEGLEAAEGYGYTVFNLMKAFAARGDVKNTVDYARKYGQWRRAYGAVIDDAVMDSAFGLKSVAQMVERERRTKVTSQRS